MSYEIVNSMLLLWGSLFCAVAGLYFWVTKNYKTEKRKWMCRMQFSASVLMLCDAVAYLFRGRPDRLGWWMVRISNFGVFFFVELTLLLFHHYICATLLTPEEDAALKRVKIGQGVCGAGLALVVVSQFTGLYYTFDAANVYHRTQWYPISVILPVVVMLLDSGLMLQYEARISRKMFLAMGSYFVLPLISASIQAVHYGWSLIDLSIGISMLLMFLVSTGEQNEELLRLEASRAQMAEKLEIATVLNRSGGREFDEATNQLLGVINDYFSADRSYICELGEDGRQVVNTHEFVQNDSAAVDTLKVPFHSESGIRGFLGVDNPRDHVDDPTLLSSLQFFVTNSLEQKKVQEKLRRMSYTDMLTGLANRNHYIEMVDSCGGRKLEQVGGIYMDLNGLKRCNDRFGHEAGDALIRRAADALNEVFPGKACRIGGDEFVVVLRPIPQEVFEAKVEQLRAALVRHGVSAAVGSVWKAEVEDMDSFLRDADDRMYQEKEER